LQSIWICDGVFRHDRGSDALILKPILPVVVLSYLTLPPPNEFFIDVSSIFGVELSGFPLIKSLLVTSVDQSLQHVLALTLDESLECTFFRWLLLLLLLILRALVSRLCKKVERCLEVVRLFRSHPNLELGGA
jgi:hypothetical protein